MKVIAGEQPPLDEIALPYDGYTAEDIAHRLIYVEASRGCPFKCEFCLSSLDKTAWAFEQNAFLQAIEQLYARGVRNFKFVDRTFNLKIEASARILQFFLDRLQASTGQDTLFVHFELIPDQLPDRLKALIQQFPPGVLQFEIGIQSFNPEVQQRISRRQDDTRTCANLRWLAQESSAHLHTDLIFGLPGESLASFAQGFDKLYGLGPQEIQMGILKRLRGTPIARHTQEFGMVYDPLPPYTVQQTHAVSAQEMQQFTRLARYWDLVANSGRFKASMVLLMASRSSPFEAFWSFSDWLWQRTGQTHRLSPETLVDALFDYLCSQGQDIETLRDTLLSDYLASGARAKPHCLAALLTRRQRASHFPAAPSDGGTPSGNAALKGRQTRHQGERQTA